MKFTCPQMQASLSMQNKLWWGAIHWLLLISDLSGCWNTQLSLLLVMLKGYVKYAFFFRENIWLNKRHLRLETRWLEYLLELRRLEKLNHLTFCNQNHSVTKIIPSQLGTTWNRRPFVVGSVRCGFQHKRESSFCLWISCKFTYRCYPRVSEMPLDFWKGCKTPLPEGHCFPRALWEEKSWPLFLCGMPYTPMAMSTMEK